MAKSSEIAVVIQAVDKFSKTAEKIEKQTSGLTKAFKTLGTIAATAFATDRMVRFFNDSIQKAEEQQRALEQLKGTYESTGGAVGLAYDELVQFSQALQMQTAIGDETIQKLEAIMLTFTNVKGEVFKEGTKLAIDMATALNIDLKSAIIQVGKALNDPVLGVSALRRVGVSLTKEQQELVKQLVETGRTLEAQKVILHELSTEFGGQAIRAAKTFEGRMRLLKAVIGDWQESIGNAIIKNESMIEGIEALTKAFRDMTTEGRNGQSAIGGLASVIGEFIKSISGGLKYIVNGISWVMRLFLGLAKSIGSIISGILAQIVTMVEGTAKVLDRLIHLKFKQAWDTAKVYRETIQGIRKDIAEDLVNAWKLEGDTSQNALDKNIQSLRKVQHEAGRTADAVIRMNAVLQKQPSKRKKTEQADIWGFIPAPDPEAIGKQLDEIFNKVQRFSDAVMSVVSPLADALVDMMNGVKVSWESVFADMLRNIERMVVEMLLRMAVISAVSTAMGMPINPAMAITTFGGVPAFAEGGYVTRPTLAVVGEKEPEYIIPESKMVGNIEIHIHNATPDTYVEVFQQLPDGAKVKIKEALS